MDDSLTTMALLPFTAPLRSRRRSRRPMLALCAAFCALLLTACNGDEGLLTPTSNGTRTPTPSVTATPEMPEPTVDTPGEPPTATESPSATPTTEVDPAARLRGPLLSVLSTGTTTQDQDALQQMEVVAVPIEGDVDGRDLWAAVTSGAGVWELSTEAGHVVAVYERQAGDTWVEVAVRRLESEPTLAYPELVVTDPGMAWIGVHGSTGAHAGTFELVRFDGATLSTALWWFSPSPAAATIADLDGDGRPELVLDSTDPYVYCYACNVRAWGELIYRWVDGEPVAVNLAPVESAGARAHALTEEAVAFVEADLWRRARSTMQLALEAAPDDAEVWWLRLAVQRTADARLADAGAEPQPLTTAVLAGEYELAVDLMRDLPLAGVFASDGPLVVGTAAEDWPDSMGHLLVDYATRAVEVDPLLAPAYAVRSVGRMLLEPPLDPQAGDTLEDALDDMEAALALQPDDRFYQDAVAFLRTLG